MHDPPVSYSLHTQTHTDVVNNTPLLQIQVRCTVKLHYIIQHAIFCTPAPYNTIPKKGKRVKAIPVQAWRVPGGWGPGFHDNRHIKVVTLSDLGTCHLYRPGIIASTHFCQRLSRSQGHSVVRRIISLENSNDTIGNRTRDLPACSEVPQPTVPPRWVPNKFTFKDLSSK